MFRASGSSRRTSSLADTAIDWLGTDRHSANVLTTARTLLALEAAIQKMLPAAMAQACRVARMEDGRVTLAVPSPAYAARLRQIAPRITAQLANSGWNLTEMQVKVQAGLLQNRINTSRPKESIPLDSQAVAAFRSLHENLRPGPLADAVAKLVTRHKDS
ncbi:MAG TPA: DciA family protein [Pusillimonas sp.]|uniref:DciA family protein n=1 Tax=Pusillimonas sp. TaxID=3040095 RepID=UPI002CBF34AD|nr:DciA family protein [Pusillimonas sp.]HUH86563.1 DciA family protein [Pusillimonas sp.]